MTTTTAAAYDPAAARRAGVHNANANAPTRRAVAAALAAAVASGRDHFLTPNAVTATDPGARGFRCADERPTRPGDPTGTPVGGYLRVTPAGVVTAHGSSGRVTTLVDGDR